MRRRLLVVLLILSVLAPAAPAAAAPYDADPLGLVPFADTTMRLYSAGTDVWEVWVCTVPGQAQTLDVSSVVADLNDEITPYFQWLSEGVYRPVFLVGGTIDATEPVTFGEPEEPFASECQTQARGSSPGGTNGALIVVDTPFDAGYGTAGGVCPEPPFTGCTTAYPGNLREAVVAAASVSTVAPYGEPQWITVAHEIGHALNWPHAFSGLTIDQATNAASRYDDPTDVMSGAFHTGDPIGTTAWNRYSSGWIDPSEVEIHATAVASYDLVAIGSQGLSMVVVPSLEVGRFYTLEARRRSSYDADLPKAGVVVREIDTRRDIACAFPAAWPPETDSWPCFATLIRVKQAPAAVGIDAVDHVLGIDDAVVLDGLTIQVTSASTAGFTVRVSEFDSGTFIDDDGLAAEPDIETIAALGITNGCNPPANDEFCPFDGVTRAQMAAFIIRALGEDDDIGLYQGLFSDVPEEAWFAGYVERLAELGITTGTGPEVFAPDRIVSRAEMAAFLIRAFGSGGNGTPIGVFADVDGDAWYIEEVEELYALGVTNGCLADPLSYCPTDDVTRAQMASFLARILSS